MDRSVIRKEVLPLAALFAGLVASTLVLDGALHRLQLVWIGRYLGIPGTLMILVAMLYSLRKRKVLTAGSPAHWLQFHKALAWLGSLLVLVHAGVHFNAWLPWLAVTAMLVNVASGLVGAFLLARARKHVESRRQYLTTQGMSSADIDAKLFWDAAALDLLKGWRTLHLPIALAFAGLALAHIAAVFLFWNWR